MNVSSEDVRRFGYSTNLSPDEVAPRVWLAVIERIFALVRSRSGVSAGTLVRTLTLELPEVIAEDGYDANWLRHALTMSSRARHFEEGDQKLGLQRREVTPPGSTVCAPTGSARTMTSS